jgi:hypothetical protein
MNNFKLDLGLNNGAVYVEIIYKQIKNVHLKVIRDLRVVLSVPQAVPDEWIVKFLTDRTVWVDKQITKYKQSSGYNNLSNIKSGSSTQLLGKDVRIYKKVADTNFIEVDEKNIYLNLKSIEDEALSNRLFNRWWRERALFTYNNEMKNIFNNIFKKYDLEIPSIVVKKMKTLWGSCTKMKGKITLNEYLLKADIRCIQYVILHELTHLLHTYHNADFYNFLTIQMPDWKERKKQLDKEVVQGL